MSKTFYWHDYETWGINPALDQPSQFAGVRTDWDLNIIGEPLVIYNQPPLHRLPNPYACAVTKITPQHAQEHGLPEPEFTSQIYQQLSTANTCSVGYNSLKFDDEVSRHLFYRNFFPIYDREWRNGNSRWDLIDVVRMCYALRPEEIEWPINDKNLPSFKLEDLSQANQLAHEQAHDALSDVYATIGLAKLIKTKKPKLFDYALSLRDKKTVSGLFDLFERKPLLYTAAFVGSQFANTTLIMPLMQHPTNRNQIICFDLRQSPQPLLQNDAVELAENMFTRSELKTGLLAISINKCPMLASLKLCDETVQKRIDLDMQQAFEHYQKILKFDQQLLNLKLTTIYQHTNPREAIPLADAQLYSGGFIDQSDASQFNQLRMADAQQWQQGGFMFQDERLNELAFQYQAKYFPQTLTQEQKQQWLELCQSQVDGSMHNNLLSIDEFVEILSKFEQEGTLSPEICEDLRQWPMQRETQLQQMYAG